MSRPNTPTYKTLNWPEYLQGTSKNCPDLSAGIESGGHLAAWGLTMAQMGFFDLSDRYANLDAKRDPLVEIDAIVPWEEFRPVLERVWRKPDEAQRRMLEAAARRPRSRDDLAERLRDGQF